MPFAHQRQGLRFLLAEPNGGLLWEQGLGKTWAAIAVALRRACNGEVRQCLVICPNTLMYNWRDEIKRHTANWPVLVLEGTIAERKRQLAQAREFFVVCNVESFSSIVGEVNAKDFDMVIVDEASRIKNPKAQRTKAVLSLRPRYRIILTGTPLTNGATDVWAPFNWIDPQTFGNYWAFQDRYCEFGPLKGPDGKPKYVTGRDGKKRMVKVFVRHRNVEELRAKIARRGYRLMKTDCLDLPEKTYQDIRVPIEGEQKRLYRAMAEEFRAVLDEMSDEQVAAEATNVLSQMLRCHQITSGILGTPEGPVWMADNAKLKVLNDLLDGPLEDKKVIVFCRYREEIQQIAQSFENRNPVMIVGGMAPWKRQDAVSAFQNDPSCTLFVGQIQTAGFGLTLTASQDVVFFSRDFSLESYLQAQDRAHRIGQTGTVTIMNLIAKDTIDELIAERLEMKEGFADVVTGDIDRKRPLRKAEILKHLGVK